MPRRLSARVELLLRKRAQARRYSRRYRRRQRAGTKLLSIEIAHAEQTIAAWVALGRTACSLGGAGRGLRLPEGGGKTGGTDEIVRVRRSELADRVVDQEDACGRSSCT